jgi:ABC-2 type transport system ATP-binding protein
VPQISVEGLRKTFKVPERRPGILGALSGLVSRSCREVAALDSVSFAIEPGELVGYIGPNGAGKSTTIKVLSGILVPDAGVVNVQGRVPWLERKAHVARIGVVFGQRTQLLWDLPVADTFDLLREIYETDPARHARARDELTQLLDLGPLLDVPARQLSLGQRMRCDLAASLLHEPDLVFLDEPTIGLDAPSKLAVRDFVKRLNRERGTTVILTTHDLDDVEALCSRVLVIGKGKVLSDGSLETLRAGVTRERWLLVDLEDEKATVSDPDATLIRRDGRRVCLRFDPERVSAAALIARISAQHAIGDLLVQPPPIEEVVARLYEKHA